MKFHIVKNVIYSKCYSSFNQKKYTKNECTLRNVCNKKLYYGTKCVFSKKKSSYD